MTLQAVDALGADSAPTAILDRVSLVLDAFDGPGRLTLAQVVRSTGLPRSSAHRMLERLVSMRGCVATAATTNSVCASSNWDRSRFIRTASTLQPCRFSTSSTASPDLWFTSASSTGPMWSTWRRSADASPPQCRRVSVVDAAPRPLRSVRHCSRSVRRSPRATHCPTSPESASQGWHSNPETAYRDSAVLPHRSAPSAAPLPRYPSARRRRPSASTTSAQRRSVWRPLPFGEASTADR